MKIHKLTLAGLLVANGASAATAITEERFWTETYAVTQTSPRLEVDNIWGSVQVRTGQPGRISVAVAERRSAPDRVRFDRSREILALDVEADASGVSFVVGNRRDRWRRFDDCDDCRVDYQFEIEVPPEAIVDVGTVMDGRIDVEGVTGTVSASNVNGPISVAGIEDCETVHSVNGRITMGFSRPPSSECRIKTINGDITLEVPADTGLDMALDLFNGEVSSELPIGPFELPATIEQVVDDGRTRYRIRKLAGMRVGAGGPTWSIASMNGDVRIRKQQ